MRTIIVTRHPGALNWLQKHHPEFRGAETVTHASEEQIAGVRVVGILPIDLAAMCGEYWHLTMAIPPEYRGKELSCEDMERFGCRIEQYLVRGPGDFCPECHEIDDWTSNGIACAECGALRVRREES